MKKCSSTFISTLIKVFAAFCLRWIVREHNKERVIANWSFKRFHWFFRYWNDGLHSNSAIHLRVSSTTRNQTSVKTLQAPMIFIIFKFKFCKKSSCDQQRIYRKRRQTFTFRYEFPCFSFNCFPKHDWKLQKQEFRFALQNFSFFITARRLRVLISLDYIKSSHINGCRYIKLIFINTKSSELTWKHFSKVRGSEMTRTWKSFYHIYRFSLNNWFQLTRSHDKRENEQSLKIILKINIRLGDWKFCHKGIFYSLELLTNRAFTF